MKLGNAALLACTAAVAAIGSLGPGAARAEEQRASTTERLMEEMVVTARRREEGLQDAPIAVSAYSGDTLDYRGVNSLDQIERFVPSLT